jgi:hypothetical protein
MEDFILKEIDKIGKVIEAILLKIGFLKKEKHHKDIIELSKVELVNKLNIDIDKLLQNEDFINILIQDYKFSLDNLSQFADLLFDFFEITDSIHEKNELIHSIQQIFSHLEKNKYPFSFKMLYMIDEFKKYTP